MLTLYSYFGPFCLHHLNTKNGECSNWLQMWRGWECPTFGSFTPWHWPSALAHHSVTPACLHATSFKEGHTFPCSTPKNHCAELQHSPRVHHQALWTEKTLEIKEQFLWVARVWDPFLRPGGTEEPTSIIQTFLQSQTEHLHLSSCWKQSLIHATSQTWELFREWYGSPMPGTVLATDQYRQFHSGAVVHYLTLFCLPRHGLDPAQCCATGMQPGCIMKAQAPGSVLFNGIDIVFQPCYWVILGTFQLTSDVKAYAYLPYWLCIRYLNFSCLGPSTITRCPESLMIDPAFSFRLKNSPSRSQRYFNPSWCYFTAPCNYWSMHVNCHVSEVCLGIKGIHTDIFLVGLHLCVR